MKNSTPRATRHKNAANFRVLTLDRYAPGMRPHKSARAMPLRQALERAHPDDRHFVAYAPRRLDGHLARLNTHATEGRAAVWDRLDDLDGPIEIRLLVGDIDAPGHEPTPRWRRNTEALLDASPYSYYATRGGYRILALPEEPFALTCAVDADHGLVLDRACKDWTRLYRLPNVVRDGETQTADVFGALEPTPVDWSALEKARPAKQARPKASHQDASPIAVVGGLAYAEAQAEARRVASTAPPSIDGKGGDAALFAARNAIQAALGPIAEDANVVLEYLRIFNKRSRFPDGRASPWDDDKLLREARAAADAQRRNRGIERIKARLRARNAEQAANDNGDVQYLFANVDPEGDGYRFAATGEVIIPPTDKRLSSVAAYVRAQGFVALDVRMRSLVDAETRKRWQDADTSRLLIRLSEEGAEIPRAKLEDALAAAGAGAAFDPVVQYLEALPAWDGKARSVFTDYFSAAPGAWADACWRVFSIGAVARALSPGCKVDTMVCLEGSQGAFKSTGLRVLAGDAHFSDSELPLDSSKAVAESLAGVWVQEIAELSGFRGRDAQRVKANLSSQVDRARMAYGRHAEEMPRRAVFVATNNPDGAGYLTDTTGNRRHLPLNVGRVDVEGLRRDRDQIWAEALARYRANEPWWIEAGSKAEKIQRRETELRTEGDPWEEPLANWCSSKDEISINDALDIVLGSQGLGGAIRTQALQNRCARVLRGLGFEKRRVRLGSERAYRYLRSAK